MRSTSEEDQRQDVVFIYFKPAAYWGQGVCNYMGVSKPSESVYLEMRVFGRVISATYSEPPHTTHTRPAVVIMVVLIEFKN